MADNYSKLWIQKTLNEAAINRVNEIIQSTGNALPCSVIGVSGSIVTIQFQVDAAPWTLPNITIPKAESPWIRMPTQIGDLGMTIPADVYLGAISGLGITVPKIDVRPGNLSALVFVPISNKNSPPIDQNAAQIEGPNGAIIRTTQGTTSSIVVNQNGTTVTYGSVTIVVTSSGVTMTVGSDSIALTSSGITLNGATTINGALTTSSSASFGGAVTANGLTSNGVSFDGHYHYVSGTPGDSGAPIA